MNIFGIGPLEILFILLIVLIFIGPNDIRKYARSAGRYLNRLYRSDGWRLLRETSRNLRTLPSRLAREAALEDLKETERKLHEDLAAVQRSIQETQTDNNGVQDDLTGEVQSIDEGLKAWTTREANQETPQEIPPAKETTDAESTS